MGIVSLFSDMTHEGGRSILGEFLNLTGASAATIGFISGLGELLGYGLRIISGRIADKTKHYWTLVILGYVIQVLAIPALALVPENGWLFDKIGLKALKYYGDRFDSEMSHGTCPQLFSTPLYSCNLLKIRYNYFRR
ncbi:MAG: hypothetical protein SO401_05055 [Blautia sp.]|nr:hypothetical protein [Blautia sp.]